MMNLSHISKCVVFAFSNFVVCVFHPNNAALEPEIAHIEVHIEMKLLIWASGIRVSFSSIMDIGKDMAILVGL